MKNVYSYSINVNLPNSVRKYNLTSNTPSWVVDIFTILVSIFFRPPDFIIISADISKRPSNNLYLSNGDPS